MNSFPNSTLGILCLLPFFYFLINGLTNPQRLENPPEEMKIRGQKIMIASLALLLLGILFIGRSLK